MSTQKFHLYYFQHVNMINSLPIKPEAPIVHVQLFLQMLKVYTTSCMLM